MIAKQLSLVKRVPLDDFHEVRNKVRPALVSALHLGPVIVHLETGAVHAIVAAASDEYERDKHETVEILAAWIQSTYSG